ncbi:MAG: NUDIX domain-containing protein [Bacilli bacterium]|nr:NUDIX domain-containing protein [Bacilli bacterium]
MKWKLLDIKQETNHPFLNFYTLTYEVEKEDGSHTYEYFMASRHDIDHLLPKTNNFTRPDGVLIPLYYIDPKTNEVSIVLTTQFRPAIGAYLTSMPAGLMDPDDKDVFETARREAEEEAGCLIDDLELLVSPSTTSSGLSDEINSIVMARIVGHKGANLEEFEDISANLVPLTKVKEMLKDTEHYHFPFSIHLIILYLLERFHVA